MAVLDKAIKYPNTEGYSFIDKAIEGTERWRIKLDTSKENNHEYPVFPDSNYNWNLNMRLEPSMKGDALLNEYPYISTYLHQSIPPSYYIKDLNFAEFEPIDDRGITKSQDGTQYLNLKDGYVEIKRHSHLPDIYEPGPDNVENKLCYYDRRDHAGGLSLWSER